MTKQRKPIVLGIEGGSGMEVAFGLLVIKYQIENLGLKVCGVDFIKPKATAFGMPEGGQLVVRLSGGDKIIIQQRHGNHHLRPPSAVNWKANMAAMIGQGLTHYVITTACGSLVEKITPGIPIIADQCFDATTTKSRHSWFFDGGPALHVPLAHPTCHCQDNLLHQAARTVDPTIQKGASYITIDGPEFGTKAEGETFVSWGYDLVGMSMARAAKLATGSGKHFSCLALPTDRDSGSEDEEAVNVTTVKERMAAMAELTTRILLEFIRLVFTDNTVWNCRCVESFQGALQTGREYLTTEQLDLLTFLGWKPSVQ